MSDSLPIHETSGPTERRTHSLIALATVWLFIVVPLVVNITKNAWGHALLNGTAMVLTSLAFASLKTGHYQRLGDYAAIAALLVLSCGMALQELGFQDPRTLLRLILLPAASFAIFGTNHFRLIIALTVFSTTVVFSADVFGFLSSNHASPQNNPTIIRVGSASLFVGILVTVGLGVRMQRILMSDIQAVLAETQRERQNAQDARDAESRFLSNMSHEIRNPLNGIIGMLHSIEGERSVERVQEQTQLALKSARALERIVDDVLDLKALDEGGIRIQISPIDLPALTKTWQLNLESISRDKSFAARDLTEIGELPNYILSDETRIFQVVMNLISNAAKFTETGEITLQFTYDFDKSELVIRVSDTGIGMDERTLSQLFQRFYQSDRQTTKRYPGSGLGMPISKALIERMGGSLEVTSVLGEGSSFKARIPAQTLETPQPPQHHVTGYAASGAAPDLSKYHFLCVDDDLINLLVISTFLMGAGAQVTKARSAQEALNLLKSNTVDVVITDIIMPGMDGLELLKEIRAVNASLPIVALTGNVMQEDVDEYLQEGFNTVIAKPVRRSLLYQAVLALG